MPFEGNHAADIGLESPEGPVCKYDSAEGKVRSGEEIFQGGVEFFASEAAGGDRELATRLTRKNMQSLAYWQAHPFALLEGSMATEDEFQSAMAKL
jgi:hypothetical protein